MDGRMSYRSIPSRGALPTMELMFRWRAIEDATTPVSFDLLLGY